MLVALAEFTLRVLVALKTRYTDACGVNGYYQCGDLGMSASKALDQRCQSGEQASKT